MRKNIVFLALFTIACMTAGAEVQQPTFPWQASNPDGNISSGLIISGFCADVLGTGLMAGSSAAISFDLGVGVGLYSGACLCLGTGAFLFNMGTENRHKGLEAMGYTITTTHRSLSKTLSWITVGCEVGAMGVGFSVGDSTAGLITAIIIGGVGACVETFNMYLTRRNWLNDINTSIAGKSPGKKPTAKAEDKVGAGPVVAPLLGVGYDAEARCATALIGVSLGL